MSVTWQTRALDAGSCSGYACPYCTAILQRTISGTEKEGLLAHIRLVHPGKPLPAMRA